MKECGIEPGDILLLVSNSNKLSVKVKQLSQSFTNSWSKHGHMEVISVFVCTGKNKYGVICHNFERQLVSSQSDFINMLNTKTIEELSSCLLSYGNNEFTLNQFKRTFKTNIRWIRHAIFNLKGDENLEEIIEHLLAATCGNKSKLIDLIIAFWHASGQSEILPAVKSSLLVFKHNDSEQRKKFLNAYLDEVKVTESLQRKGKHRTSFFALFKSYFSKASQDQNDREQRTPAIKTFCSSNLMQVLNQIDPNLVNRGRHVLPKALEAGLREATQNKINSKNHQEETEDFESLIKEQKHLLAPFRMEILPAAGNELLHQLLATIDQEIYRMQHKIWKNKASRKKVADLKELLLPYRHIQFQSYPINLQVNISLKIIATVLPVLQRKTGILGQWMASTSYANVRAFARTQGIFDGDIRKACDKLKNDSSIQRQQEEKNVITGCDELSNEYQIYIFSDWSFSSWSPHKRQLILEHMLQLIETGNVLYTYENDHLVEMTKESLYSAIHDLDFDDLLACKLKPATRTDIIHQAKQQKIDTSKITFLDYQAIKKLACDNEPIVVSLNQSSPLFASKMDDYHLNQAKKNIVDIEIANALGNEELQNELRNIRNNITEQTKCNEHIYQSGVDTKALVAQCRYRKPIFKSLDLAVPSPSSNYYRNEIYSELAINPKPTSHFEYFELRGMNKTENLIDCEYQFQSHGLTNEIINKRKSKIKQTLFKGEKSIVLTSDWHALPSLAAGEKLLDVAINGLTQKDFEIKYSNENHLYYVRLTHSENKFKDVSVELLLQMPTYYCANPIFNTLAALPKQTEIHRLLMKYLKFGKDDGGLRNSVGTTVHDGHEYLNEARKRTAASCRLRCIAFKEEMTRLHPEVPVSIVVNSNHCFIEMDLDGTYQRYCLGGYRDVPNVVEKLKTHTLDFCSKESQQHRFFAGLAKVKDGDKNDNQHKACMV